jgi:hypothetical protein
MAEFSLARDLRSVALMIPRIGSARDGQQLPVFPQ